MELCVAKEDKEDKEVGDQLIAACQRGDKAAFGLLFEAYKDKVYSIAIHFFHGDETAAKDITQQVFLKLFTKVQQFRHRADFGTWLYRLVVNACMDEQRHRGRFVAFDDITDLWSNWTQRETPDEPLVRQEVVDLVQDAVAKLKPKLRMAILLKYFEDLSYEEMARVLGCSTGTVASRLNRAHKVLARKLAHLRSSII
jgi:RNA polymerase sigma-70 factor (ECF subfamily)